MKLPYGEAARLEQIARKVETYLLNTEHPKGKHKARLFKAKLGITIESKEVGSPKQVMIDCSGE